MTLVWEKLKKNLIDSLNLAIDKTEELTSVGRIKLEILQLEHQIDEKFARLGKHTYSLISDETATLEVDEKTKELRLKILQLEKELTEKEKELVRIKEEDGIDFDS